MSEHIWTIGIDLGLNGAICILRNDESTWYPIPVVGKHIDWDKLKTILEEYHGVCFVGFEKLGQIFQSSKATAMSMGRQSEGMIVMCKCLGLPYREIPPKEWQGEMFKGIDKIIKKGGKGVDTKAMALEKIKQIYPNLKLTFGDRATKAHDGLVDATLIALFARKFL
jgi:hypothetical protein